MTAKILSVIQLLKFLSSIQTIQCTQALYKRLFVYFGKHYKFCCNYLIINYKKMNITFTSVKYYFTQPL